MLEMHRINFSSHCFCGIIRFNEHTVFVSFDFQSLLSAALILCSFRDSKDFVVLFVESKTHSLQLLLPLFSKLLDSSNLLGIDKDWAFITI